MHRASDAGSRERRCRCRRCRKRGARAAACIFLSDKEKRERCRRGAGNLFFTFISAAAAVADLLRVVYLRVCARLTFPKAFFNSRKSPCCRDSLRARKRPRKEQETQPQHISCSGCDCALCVCVSLGADLLPEGARASPLYSSGSKFNSRTGYLRRKAAVGERGARRRPLREQ
jgi:hypothetical protein